MSNVIEWRTQIILPSLIQNRGSCTQNSLQAQSDCKHCKRRVMMSQSVSMTAFQGPPPVELYLYLVMMSRLPCMWGSRPSYSAGLSLTPRSRPALVFESRAPTGPGRLPSLLLPTKQQCLHRSTCVKRHTWRVEPARPIDKGDAQQGRSLQLCSAGASAGCAALCKRESSRLLDVLLDVAHSS